MDDFGEFWDEGGNEAHLEESAFPPLTPSEDDLPLTTLVNTVADPSSLENQFRSIGYDRNRHLLYLCCVEGCPSEYSEERAKHARMTGEFAISKKGRQKHANSHLTETPSNGRRRAKRASTTTTTSTSKMPHVVTSGNNSSPVMKEMLCRRLQEFQGTCDIAELLASTLISQGYDNNYRLGLLGKQSLKDIQEGLDLEKNAHALCLKEFLVKYFKT